MIEPCNLRMRFSTPDFVIYLFSYNALTIQYRNETPFAIVNSCLIDRLVWQMWESRYLGGVVFWAVRS